MDTDQLIEDCQAIIDAGGAASEMREVVAKFVSDPARAMQAVGEPSRGGIQRIHVADDLTIINVVWAPRMTLRAHNHNMWAVIGVYEGREDNIFWRKVKDDPDGRIEAAGAKSIGRAEVRPLGRDIVHSVTNPTPKFTGAIHVYGGNFFTEERSEWDPESLIERPYDIDANMALFEEANKWWAPGGSNPGPAD